jgi:hypothetical protein
MRPCAWQVTGRVRLRALAALGHPDPDVAGWLGITPGQLHELRAGRVLPDRVIAAAVTDVWAREGVRRGPCEATRRRARSAGWGTTVAHGGGRLCDAVAAADELVADLTARGLRPGEIAQLLRADLDWVLFRLRWLGLGVA